MSFYNTLTQQMSLAQILKARGRRKKMCDTRQCDGEK